MIMIEIIAMTLQQSKHGRDSPLDISNCKTAITCGEENIVSESRLNLGIILIMLLCAFRKHNSKFYVHHFML